MANRKIKLGIYQHYKGGEYELIAVAHHSETLEEMVVYKTLSKKEGILFEKGSIWVRPLGMFIEEIEIDGKHVPRFRFLYERAGKEACV